MRSTTVIPTSAVRANAGAEPEAVVLRPTREQAETAIRTLIAFIGDDPNREGLRDTPRRIVGAYQELFSGYDRRGTDILDRFFSEIGTYDDLVLIRDIPFSSHCEHHMMPFFGVGHVAYLPVERVVGLSKIARLIDIYARRLQSQERLSSQLVETLHKALKPRGVAVMLEAEHTCMSMRGVQKAGSSTVTTQFTGVFRDDAGEQLRFIQLVRSGTR